jgi:hypothetical protein
MKKYCAAVGMTEERYTCELLRNFTPYEERILLSEVCYLEEDIDTRALSRT